MRILAAPFVVALLLFPFGVFAQETTAGKPPAAQEKQRSEAERTEATKKAPPVAPPKGAPSVALPLGVTRVTSVEGITEYRLANGLKVLLFPDLSKPTITVSITYLVGSRHE